MLILNLPRRIKRKMPHKKILPIPYIIPVSVFIRFSASMSSISAALWAFDTAIFFIFLVVKRNARSNETKRTINIAMEGSCITHQVINLVSISFQKFAVNTAGTRDAASFVFQKTITPSICVLSGMFFSITSLFVLSHQESSKLALLIRKFVLTFGTETTISPEEGRK